jgi:GNAT superfamily N-acetyltransferase
MEIRAVVTEDDLRSIRELFSEYFAWVRDEHGINLGYQGIADELASLPGVYAPPRGCLLLAQVEGRAAGCVALKPLAADICELKRMYVRPPYRGRGLGVQLGERVLAEAARAGYRLIRLDTADTMLAAQRLYGRLGFRPAPPYYEAAPEIMARARFMERAVSA